MTLSYLLRLIFEQRRNKKAQLYSYLDQTNSIGFSRFVPDCELFLRFERKPEVPLSIETLLVILHFLGKLHKVCSCLSHSQEEKLFAAVLWLETHTVNKNKCKSIAKTPVLSGKIVGFICSVNTKEVVCACF